MKRFLLLTAMIVLILACFSSCGLSGKKKCDHRAVNDPAVAPTCTQSGLTDGKHCSKCGDVLVKQQTIAPLGHTEVIDEAVAATCTDDGLTAGVHCSVCNKKIVAQKVVPATHTYGEWQKITEPDCFFEGEQTRACSACDDVDTQKIAKIEHSFVQNEETKLFACEHCDARIYAGHLYAAFEETVNWYDAYKMCDSLGGHLVTITSDDEQNLLTDIVNSRTLPEGKIYYFYWTGAIKNTAGWEWITGENFLYTHWGIQGNDNYTANWHIGLVSTIIDETNIKNKVGDWEDVSHTGYVGLICEWELDIIEDEHYFTEWETVVEPTCFGGGEKYRICTHCGIEETEILPQLEHNFLFNEATGVTACEHCSAAKYDGRIYKIFNIQLSWFDAYSYCDDLGGHLMTITSAEEQTFIETYMKSLSFTSTIWMGAYNDGAKWQWVTDEAFDYKNWGVTQPDNMNDSQYFASINYPSAERTGVWDDNGPYGPYYFICEWEAE